MSPSRSKERQVISSARQGTTKSSEKLSIGRPKIALKLPLQRRMSSAKQVRIVQTFELPIHPEASWIVKILAERTALSKQSRDIYLLRSCINSLLRSKIMMYNTSNNQFKNTRSNNQQKRTSIWQKYRNMSRIFTSKKGKSKRILDGQLRRA